LKLGHFRFEFCFFFAGGFFDFACERADLFADAVLLSGEFLALALQRADACIDFEQAIDRAWRPSSWRERPGGICRDCRGGL